MFERASTAYRSTAVQLLVDEGQMTFSEVGELAAVSRQMVARLYRLVGGCDAVTEGEGA